MNDRVVGVIGAMCFALCAGLAGAEPNLQRDGEAKEIFRLKCAKQSADAWTEVLPSMASDVRRQITPDGEATTYRYDDTNSPVVEVTSLFRRGADDERRYRLRVRTREGWHLARADHPRLIAPLQRDGNADDERLMISTCKGGVWRNPSASPLGTTTFVGSPGRCAGQFGAVWNSDAGLYFGVEDAKGYLKYFGFERCEDCIEFRSEENMWLTGTFEQDYDIVRREVHRRSSDEPLAWCDFADLSRRWNARQDWCRTRYLDRADIPSWMKDAPAFTRFSRQWLERPERIAAFVEWWKREFGEMPVVTAFWGWEKVGTWWGPDYFPCHPNDEVFTRTVADLKANGFHTFTWPSGYNWCKVIGDRGDGTYEWDGRERFVKPNEQHLIENADGTLFHRDAFWLRNGALTQLCGGDAWTRTWWNDVVRQLGERGCEMVQVDQVVGGRLDECWSARHGHPRGPGLWMMKSFREQFTTMRETLRRVCADGVVGVEEPNEMLNGVAGIQDYRDLESNADEFAGTYSYLYHEFVPLFQSNPFSDEPYSLAFMAAEGQMPFLRPRFEMLEEKRPALMNGGFENLSDNVRGPDAWNRLIVTALFTGWDGTAPLWDFSGCNNSGWLGYSVTLDETVRHSGSYSLKFDPPREGGRDKGCPMQVSQTVENLADGDYTLVCWVKNDDTSAPAGSLRYGTRAGEQGAIDFPAATEWTKVEAKVKVKKSSNGRMVEWSNQSTNRRIDESKNSLCELRLIIWAPPGSRFHIDDIALLRGGQVVETAGDTMYLDFMKRWIRLYRGEGRSWLAYGRRIRPPRLKCATTKVAARTLPAVCCAAYENVKGEKAMALANGTGRTQPLSCLWNGAWRSFEMAPHELRLVPLPNP